MKFKLADIPVNVLDGLDILFTQYQKLNFAYIGVLIGVLLYSAFRLDFAALGWAFAGIVAGLVLAYFVGRK